jgi:hypothetical protein
MEIPAKSQRLAYVTEIESTVPTADGKSRRTQGMANRHVKPPSRNKEMSYFEAAVVLAVERGIAAM